MIRLTDIRNKLRDLAEVEHTSLTSPQFRSKVEEIVRDLQEYEAQEPEGDER